MSDNEHDECERPTVTPLPAWIKPILRDEAEKRAEATRQYADTGRHAADAINRYLTLLDIEPLSPAAWSRQTGLTKAVLLEPGQCDVDDWGVSVGWTDEITLYSFTADGAEYVFGPLGSVQDAADARRGPRGLKPLPPDHELLAEAELRQATPLSADDADPFDVAFVAAMRGAAHAVLALNETISRLGVRQALRQAAALGQIPLEKVRVTAEEKQLLGELFPDLSAVAADAEQIAELSALDGA